ncbi:MAG TPA: hypothetical protein DCL35_07360 [Candidatus Omnitrophica bacterium]|nr:hypothetical protein [Candidatus Omnitrophota bacterium]
MATDGLQIIAIETSKISPNSYNPNIISEDILAKLRQEIAQKGLTQPIIVRSRGDAYEVVDGEHRWRICRDLGIQEIPCIIQDYADNEAKIKTLQLNYLRGYAIPIKLASLIHDLNKEISIQELAKRLPYEEPQLMDSLELLKLPENFGNEIEAQALKEQTELPSVVSFVLYKNQLEVMEEALKIAIQLLPDGAKNLKALALEKICADYIVGHKVASQDEIIVEAA